MALSFCPKMQVYAREGKVLVFLKICASQVFTSRGFALFSAYGIGVFRQIQIEMREKLFAV